MAVTKKTMDALHEMVDFTDFGIEHANSEKELQEMVNWKEALTDVINELVFGGGEDGTA